jgi:hypothetical protein|nr:hypothetical protein [Enterococcus faecalis]
MKKLKILKYMEIIHKNCYTIDCCNIITASEPITVHVVP